MKEFIDAYMSKGKVNEKKNAPEMQKEKAEVVNIFKEYANSLTEDGSKIKVNPNMVRQFLNYVEKQFQQIQSDSKRIQIEDKVLPILTAAFEKIHNVAKDVM